MEKTKKMLDIGEVTKLSGLPPSTLRYYEEKGLIRSIGRTGLRRLYDRRVLEQIEFIALGQIAGFELKDIAAMFTNDGRLVVDRKLVTDKAIEISHNIKQLGAIQNILEHVAKCSAPDHLQCPKFLRLLQIAGKKQNLERKIGKKAKKTSKNR